MSFTVSESELEDASIVCGANPGASTLTWYDPDSAWNTTVPSAELICTATGLAEFRRMTCAPETASDCGSTTLTLISAAEATTARERTPTRIPRNRITNLLCTRKGLC